VTLVGIAVGVASLMGMNEVVALLIGGIIGIVLYEFINRQKKSISGWLLPSFLQLPVLLAWTHAKAAASVSAAGIAGVSLWKLGFFFLKIGSVLFGSGYVLVAYLEGGLVKEYGWLTNQQLLDAIAIGQFTPGPVLSTATFVGYVLSGIPGAVVATVAIFLPSFLFVLILNPAIARLRASKIMSAFLDAVNVSAIGLMASVVVSLAGRTLTDWRAIVIAIIAATTGIRFKLNNVWLILGGAMTGWLLSLI
jgi:chromate transporter